MSECLTGAPVRYDGGHRAYAWPRPALEGLYEFRPICPEVGIGLGVPRPPIRLVGAPASPRAVGVEDPSVDVSDRLRAYAGTRLPDLDDVDGYVFKARSPSCGLEGVALHADPQGPPAPEGTGLFAAEIASARPALPLEDGENLFEPGALESFVTRTFVHAFWRRATAGGIDAARLIAFHSACKYLVMAHDASAYRRLGRLLADLSGNAETTGERYFEGLMRALAARPTRRSHTNVLQHLQGYLRGAIGAPDRRAVAAAIERYRSGEAALETPLHPLRQRLREAGARYAFDQYYLHVPRVGPQAGGATAPAGTAPRTAAS